MAVVVDRRGGAPRRSGGRAARVGSAALFSSLALAAPCRAATHGSPVEVTLASGGRTSYAIALPASASEPEAFAASELAAYLRRITGATFAVVRGAAGARAIVLRTGSSAATAGLAGDAYAIAVRGERIYLTGGSPRAVLYAAYDLLERLGCRWLAPSFDYYDGASEIVPRAPTLVYRATGDVIERPTFAIRKLDMAGARSHTVETVRQIVEWMPKLRFNTLMVSMKSGPRGSVTWDDWRGPIVPELKKRGLTLEVGGHGYQNFLAANMRENGETLFQRHPDWFGRDSSCAPSRSPTLVFDTGNPDAVAYLVGNVVKYVTAHPEIDVFDFWPPDGARWAECRTLAAEGSVEDRHARLVRQLHDALKRARPDLRLEVIAYAHAKLPPAHEALPADVLVDFCPIGQDFDVPIYDPSAENNAIYVDAIRRWRRAFPGEIGLYSYYRKYAWRSLPNVLPHYMQHDLEWYASIPLQGISSYAEPGDWSTYELNHYALGRLAWNPRADVDSLVDDFVHARYGAASEAAGAALRSLENVFRVRGSIPYSGADSAAAIARAHAEIVARRAAVLRVRKHAHGPLAASLDRLALMLDFAARDLDIVRTRAEAHTAGSASPELRAKVQSLVSFLTANRARGVFVVYGGDDFARYLKHYTRDWQAVGPAAGPGEGE